MRKPLKICHFSLFVQKLGRFRTLCLQLNITKQKLWRNPSLSDTPKHEQLAAHPINHIHITSPQKNAHLPMKTSTLAGLEDEFPLKNVWCFLGSNPHENHEILRLHRPWLSAIQWVVAQWPPRASLRAPVLRVRCKGFPLKRLLDGFYWEFWTGSSLIYIYINFVYI